jgi:hypothetical protein
MINVLIGALLMSLLIAQSNLSIASNEQDIMQVIDNYVQGTEENNVSLIEQSFHPDFRVVALTEEGTRILDKQNYLNLLKAKKIGGTQRTLNIKQLNIQNQFALVSLSLEGEKVIFNDQLQLVQLHGTWQIVNNLTQVTPYSRPDN